MASLNRVEIIGHLGRDPETKVLQGGQSVCNFTVATSETWKDKAGDKQERTEWHRVVSFGKVAEICGKYLHKGSLVYLAGKIQSRTWEDKQGAKQTTTEIVISEMLMLDGKSGGTKPEAPKQGKFDQGGGDIPF